MSISIIRPLMTSLMVPLETTVITDISERRGTSFSMNDDKTEFEIKNIPNNVVKKLKSKSIKKSDIVVQDSSSTPINNDILKQKTTQSANPSKPNAVDVLAQQQLVVSPVFKLVFLTVVALTIFSGSMAILLAFVGDGVPPNQRAVVESMNTGWKLGLGAIFGLLSGKAS